MALVLLVAGALVLTASRAAAQVGFPGAPDDAAPFFRSGQAEGWKDELPTDVARKIEDDHREMMDALGYL